MKIEYGYKIIRHEIMVRLIHVQPTKLEYAREWILRIFGILTPLGIFTGFIAIAIEYDLPLEPFFIALISSFIVTSILIK